MLRVLAGASNPKHALFVTAYLDSLNATKAAIAAGYSEKAANQAGYRLLRLPSIAAAIAEAQAARLTTGELSAARTLEEMRRVAFSNVKRLFHENNNLKAMSELTDEEASCIASVEIVKKNLVAGDGIYDTVIKVKMWDKIRALEMLGKHFALLIEQIHLTGDAEVIARLQGARARVKG